MINGISHFIFSLLNNKFHKFDMNENDLFHSKTQFFFFHSIKKFIHREMSKVTQIKYKICNSYLFN